MAKVKVGEKFRVVNEEQHCFKKGDIIKYISTDYDGDRWYIDKDGREQTLTNYQVEPLLSKSTPKFKVGDYVEVIELDDLDKEYTNVLIGMGGKITRIIDGKCKYEVDVFDFDTLIAYEHQLEFYDTKKGYSEPKSNNKVEQLESNSLADFYRIGDVTIAYPKGMPLGIAKLHDDDKYCEESGKGIAFKRLMEQVNDYEEEEIELSDYVKSILDLWS